MGNESLKQAAPPFTDNPNVWFLERPIPSFVTDCYPSLVSHGGERCAVPKPGTLTIVVPQRNESRSISTTFASLALALGHMHPDLDTHVLFVSNACTDDSPKIIDGQLVRFGEHESIDAGSLFIGKDGQYTDLFDDPGLHPEALSSRRGNVRMTHIVTATPGKPNATNNGLRLAIARGDSALISTDANNTIHPESLWNMFRLASAHFDETTVIAASTLKTFFEPSKYTYFTGRANKVNTYSQMSNEPPRDFSGALYAVSVPWLQSIGGVPHTLIEDHTMSKIARDTGKKIIHGGGTVYARGYSSLSNQVNASRRALVGRRQESRLIGRNYVDDVRHDSAYKMIGHKVKRLLNGQLSIGEFALRSMIRVYLRHIDRHAIDEVSIEPTESTR